MLGRLRRGWSRSRSAPASASRRRRRCSPTPPRLSGLHQGFAAGLLEHRLGGRPGRWRGRRGRRSPAPGRLRGALPGDRRAAAGDRAAWPGGWSAPARCRGRPRRAGSRLRPMATATTRTPTCGGRGLAQLGRRPGLPPGRGARAARAATSWPRRCARGRRGGTHGQRPGLRALLHRGGDDRRDDDPDRGAERACIDADPGIGPGQGRRRDRPRRPQRATARARPGDGEPRRHRPPDDRRRDLDRDPRHRRRACATSPPRSRRSSWSSPTAACAS